jgi:uncharacterized membrane protein
MNYKLGKREQASTNDGKLQINQRIWEIDFLRGVAIVLMVVYHIVFDLNYFYGFKTLVYNTGFWYYLGRSSATLFIILSGMTSVILYRKYGYITYQKNLRRGLEVLFFAMLITAGSYYFDPTQTIWFGILHLLGISIILSSFFLRYFWINIIIAGGIIFISGMDFFVAKSNWLLFLGFTQAEYNSFDYYPFLPWFAVMLLGIVIAQLFYPHYLSYISRQENIITKWVGGMGKYSLPIYLLHQPVILMMLYMIK